MLMRVKLLRVRTAPHPTKVGQTGQLFDAGAACALFRDKRAAWTEGGITFSSEGWYVEVLSAAAWYRDVLTALNDRELEALEALTMWYSAIERDRTFRAAVRGDLRTWPEDYPVPRSKEARRRARRRYIATLPPEKRDRLPRPPRNRPVDPTSPLYLSLERVGLTVPQILALCRGAGLLPLPPEEAAAAARERYEVSIRDSVQAEIERARKRERSTKDRTTEPLLSVRVAGPQSAVEAPTEVKLQSFTVAQELAAEAAAAAHGTPFEHELLQRCTLEIDGKPFDQGGDRIDRFPPRVRVALISALNKISLPTEAATKEFLRSEVS